MSTDHTLRRALGLTALALLASVLAPAACTAATNPLPDDATVVFLHHSTGGIIWNAGVPAWFNSYNAAHGTSYAIGDLGDPAGDNNPYDYWNIWVNHAGPTAYLGQSTLEMLTPLYDVIAFKHCFPVSDIYADTGVPDVTSVEKKTENYELQYEALKTKLHSFPSNRFVLWTGAAELQSATSEEMALRARAFFDWVVNEWDEPGDNIYVWDFFDLETEGGIYLKPENGSSDSHPNATFAAEVAPLFCQRLVDVIRGVGDTAGTAGVPGSDTGLALSLAGANPTAGPVRLRFSLPQAARVQLGIYDTAGRRVALVTDGDSPAGTRALIWDNRATGCGAGVYFARLRAGDQKATQRIVILD
jgi:hypothetical protein